jgi:hypothetical protein
MVLALSNNSNGVEYNSVVASGSEGSESNKKDDINSCIESEFAHLAMIDLSGGITVSSPNAFVVWRHPETRCDRQNFVLVETHFTLQYRYECRAEAYSEFSSCCRYYGTYSKLILLYDSKTLVVSVANIEHESVQRFLMGADVYTECHFFDEDDEDEEGENAEEAEDSDGDVEDAEEVVDEGIEVVEHNNDENAEDTSTENAADEDVDDDEEVKKELKTVVYLPKNELGLQTIMELLDVLKYVSSE